VKGHFITCMFVEELCWNLFLREILCILIYIANQLSNYRSVPGKKTGQEKRMRTCNI